MPRLNSRGDVLCGGGGDRGSLNGTYWPFVTVGGGQWYTDEIALLQLADPVALALVSIHTLTPVVLDPPRGANSFAAGGGKYLAQLGGFGLYGDVPAILPAAGLPQNGVGRDGTRVYTPNAQAGYGLHGINPDGSVFDLPTANPFDVQVLGPSCVIWQHGAHGRAVPKPALANANGILLVAYHGQDWLLYWSEGTGVVLQPDGASEGWVLEPRPLAFARDVIVLNDAIHIAWSVTSGERPQDLVICEVTPNGVTFPVKAAGWTPPTPVWRTLVMDPMPPDPEPEPPDPEPEPEPPDPEPEPEPEPEPPGTYAIVKGAHMETERGWLIGPGDRALTVGPNGKAAFDRTELTDADLIEAQPQADGRCVCRHVSTGKIAGADATGFNPSGNPALEYYWTNGGAGNYELWSFGQWPSGIVQAVVEYVHQGANNGRPFQAAGLTWVKQ